MAEKTIPEKLDEIFVKTPSMRRYCWITGIAILSDNRLVVSDRHGYRIKLINLTTKTMLSELQLDMAPWGLVKVDDKRIAVTTQGANTILIMNVSDHDGITVEKMIDKSEFVYCWGIACSKELELESLAVFCQGPDQIQFLDQEGTVNNTVESAKTDGTVKFGGVYSIAYSADAKTIYVADNTDNKLLHMSLDGVILASYSHEHLEYPKGFAVGRDGNLFVCSQGTNKIYAISPDLSKGEIILDEKDGISNPCSILYNELDHRLYVGSHNNNSIQVFLM